MPNIVNRLISAEYEREFQDAAGMVLMSMSGLTVEEVEGVRGSMAEKGVKLRMVRNKLARRVLKERGLDFEDEVIAGNIGIAYGDAEAAIHAAKVASAPEVRKAGKLRVKAGVLDGAVLGEADAKALADVPDKDTLRAQLVGCIQGPGRSLASLLNAVPGGVARVLQARVDSGGGAEAAE